MREMAMLCRVANTKHMLCLRSQRPMLKPSKKAFGTNFRSEDANKELAAG